MWTASYYFMVALGENWSKAKPTQEGDNVNPGVPRMEMEHTKRGVVVERPTRI